MGEGGGGEQSRDDGNRGDFEFSSLIIVQGSSPLGSQGLNF